MIISDLYQTKIECLNINDDTPLYNVNIDSTNLKVVVSLIDFNGEAVTDKRNVTLTVNKGSFSSLTTTSSDYDSVGVVDGKTVVATTNGEGKFAVIYNASEFGTVTFSVNNVVEHIKVKGVKTIVSDVCYEFEDRYAVKLNGTYYNVSSPLRFDMPVSSPQNVSSVLFTTSGNWNVFMNVYSNGNNSSRITFQTTQKSTSLSTDEILSFYQTIKECWVEWSKF